MKKIINLKYVLICFVAVGAFMLQSCSEDETFDVVGTTENKVYVNTQTWNPINTPKNSILFNVTNTPIGSIIKGSEVLEVQFGVQCTHKTSKDLKVKFAYDNSLVKDGFMALPSGVTLNFDKTELTIAKGAIISTDSIKISIDSEDLALLAPGKYMVPVKIAAVNNGNSGISANLSTVFLIIEAADSNVFSPVSATEMVGAIVPNKTGWTGTVNATLVSGTPASMFSGTSTYWRVNPQVFTWSVDMVSQQTGITGIRIHTNNAAYNFTKLKVLSSLDGETWVDQGITDVVIGNAYQYLKFYTPVNARHLKFEVLGWRSATQIRVAIFDIYVTQ